MPDTEVQKIYRTWLGTGFFRPRNLTSLASNHKMRAVYLPVWECRAQAYSHWTAMSGINHQREEQYETTENGERVIKTRTVTDTEWRPVEGQHQEVYSRELVSGSKGLPQDWIKKLGDFDFGHLQSYNPQFLIGREAEESALDQTSAFQVARKQIEEQEERACAALVPGDTHRDLRVNTRITDLDARLMYLPVWLASFQYQDTLYRCVVNGQSGQIGGEAPVSKGRVALVAAAVLVAIVGLILALSLLSRNGARVAATPTVRSQPAPTLTVRIAPTPTVTVRR